MLFNKENKNTNQTNLVKIGALLIHAAKIDENYSIEEGKIIKNTLLNLGADEAHLDNLMNKAEQYEKDTNQILVYMILKHF